MKKWLSRRCMGAVFALVLVVSSLTGAAPGTGITARAAGDNQWDNATALPGNNDVGDGLRSFGLTRDVTLNSTWEVPRGELILYLNGHTITYSGDEAAIHAGDGSRLTIADSVGGGYLTAPNGTGVLVEGGLLGIGDATIQNCGESGVSVNSYGQFIMVDGAIIQNCGGAGVAIGPEGNCEMYGGTIQNCGGAGVAIGLDSYCQMIGGTIQNCEAGGVTIASGGYFRMADGIITENTNVNGGGVSVLEGASGFTMNGGTITGNTATGNGGGVYVSPNTEEGIYFNGEPRIIGNTVSGAENNIYLASQSQVDSTLISAKIMPGDLTETASLGVSMQIPGIFTASEEYDPASDYISLFSSDNPSFTIETEGNELKLVAVEPEPEEEPETVSDNDQPADTGSGDKPESGPETYDVYRLYNPNTGEHFYTQNAIERDALASAGWVYEGVAMRACDTGDPVYRCYNGSIGDHEFTRSEAERDSLVKSGWTYEGIAWYAPVQGGIPMYRVYNPNAYAGNHSGAHHYTANTAERDSLIALGWKDEGVGWHSWR